MKFKHKVLAAQYFSTIIFFIFCMFLYRGSKNKAEKDIPLIQNAFELQFQMSQLKLNIVQIQQWLSDISATRAENGLNDGFAKAAESFENSKKNIENIKKINNLINNIEIKNKLEIIPNSLSYFYKNGIKMANNYINGGTKSGNEFMPVFDKASTDLQGQVTALEDIVTKVTQLEINKTKNDLLYLGEMALYLPIIILVIILIFSYLFIGEMNKVFQKTIEELVENSTDLEGASLSLYENAQQLYKSVENQSKEADTTSSAIYEISSMVDNNAEFSKKAQNSTENTVNLTGAGNEILERALIAVDDLAINNNDMLTDVENLNQHIGNMVDIIKNVEDKTKIINEIVFQTKLLSFNASVEAARAGDHGKGFAVVAQEVGNLAQMSGLAAQEINAILTSSISKVNEITNMSSLKAEQIKKISTEKVIQCKEVIKEAKNSMDNIFKNIKIIDEMNREISHSSDEQSIGVRDINKSLQSISISINNNKDVAEESAEQSQVLNIQSIKLGKTINDFLVYIEGKNNSQFDFKLAISAHLGWRTKLNNYLTAADGSLKRESVCLDNQCALGKWIYGEGLKYKNTHTDLYTNLLTSHAEFHANLGNIVDLINSGNKEAAIFEMRPKSKYIISSKKTVALIKEIQKLNKTRS